MDQMLLIDCCSSSNVELQLSESNTTTRNGLTKFRGKFQEAEAVNKNKRMYPFDVLNENITRLQECISDRGLIGELDHPSDSIIHFANASHVVTKLWWDGQVLMGEGEILNTPSGLILKNLIDGGVKVGISSRGVGNGKVNENGILVIGEGYKLITFDAVADPSTFEAFQKKVSSKQENFKENIVKNDVSKENIENNSKNSLKNENSSIDKVNKEVLVAFLEGFIKSNTEKINSKVN